MIHCNLCPKQILIENTGLILNIKRIEDNTITHACYKNTPPPFFAPEIFSICLFRQTDTQLNTFLTVTNYF